MDIRSLSCFHLDKKNNFDIVEILQTIGLMINCALRKCLTLQILRELKTADYPFMREKYIEEIFFSVHAEKSMPIAESWEASVTSTGWTITFSLVLS